MPDEPWRAPRGRATLVGSYRRRSDGVSVADQRMVGKIGRVSGTIEPGRLGEVMIPIRGGTEHFHAYGETPTTVLAVGTRVVVIEYFPPRTVVVTPM